MSTTFDLSILKLNLEVTMNNYKKLTKSIYDQETKDLTKEEILSRLMDGRKEFEALMDQAYSLPASPDDEALKDLQYKIFDNLIYSGDLYNFYHEDLFDRFRLRIENQNQKERVNRLL